MVFEVGVQCVGAVGQHADGKLFADQREQTEHVRVGFTAVLAPGGEGVPDAVSVVGREAVGDVLGPLLVGEDTDAGESVGGVLVGVAVDGSFGQAGELLADAGAAVAPVTEEAVHVEQDALDGRCHGG
ncbi:hypothetical protein ACH4NF_34915 [Streptomyces sp. NPDC017248]|uniref:hypothetical protein n=1 Tax=unclassified Streptomyces TaxID=2593676 RepID=UPI0037AFD44D